MRNYEIMIQFLRSALTGEKLNTEYPADIVSDADLFKLAASHSVANVISVGFLNNGINPEGTIYEQAELQAAFADAQIEAVVSSIRAAFEANHITFVPAFQASSTMPFGGLTANHQLNWWLLT